MNRTNRRFQERLTRMSDNDAQRIIRRQINNKLNMLSSRYDRAVTNHQRVHILNQTEDLCIAEIDYWTNIIAINTESANGQSVVGSTERENLNTFTLEEASYHISNFQEAIKTINALRKELMNA